MIVYDCRDASKDFLDNKIQSINNFPREMTKNSVTMNKLEVMKENFIIKSTLEVTNY